MFRHHYQPDYMRKPVGERGSLEMGKTPPTEWLPGLGTKLRGHPGTPNALQSLLRGGAHTPSGRTSFDYAQFEHRTN